MDDVDPWDWIPHVEGADRQKEINAYLKKMVDEMPIAERHPGALAMQHIRAIFRCWWKRQ